MLCNINIDFCQSLERKLEKNIYKLVHNFLIICVNIVSVILIKIDKKDYIYNYKEYYIK